jgi:CHAD domain-containing protein
MDLASHALADLEAIAALLRSPDDIDAAVHETRTGIKRLRAFMRLARASVGNRTYRVEDRSLRDAARLIAPARDARVLIDMAASEAAAPMVIAVLEQAHADAIEQLEDGLRQEVVRRLESTADRWAELGWGGPPTSSIRVGLGATYRQARADRAAVVTEPADIAFHGWRRRVKYLRYQLEAVEASNELVAPYTALGDDLGLEHDHTVLIGVCSTSADNEAFTALVRRSIARRAALRASALEVGERLFAIDPEAFVNGIETDVARR